MEKASSAHVRLFAFADRSVLKVGGESLPCSPGTLAASPPPPGKGGSGCVQTQDENFTQQVFLQRIPFCLCIGIKLRVKCSSHNRVVCWVFNTDLRLCGSYSNHRPGAPLTQESPCAPLPCQASPLSRGSPL